MKYFQLCLVLLQFMYSSIVAQNSQPLQNILNPDGTLKLDGKFRGTLDINGWKMHTAPNGAPRFVPTSVANVADTAWDNRFASGNLLLNGDVDAIATNGTEIYVGGTFLTIQGNSVACILKWDGMSWSPLGSGMDSYVYALMFIGADLYAGGQFTTAGGVTVDHIARWDGNQWHALGSGTNSKVLALTRIGSDLYAAGLFTSAGGTAAKGVAKWDGSAWSSLGSGLINIPNLDQVNALTAIGSVIYAGGYFTTGAGAPGNYIAQWDGSNWSALGTGLNASVNALSTTGGDLYAGGDFSTAGGNTSHYIAKWNGVSWESLGSGVSAPVLTLCVDGSNVYAGGSFSFEGPSTVNHVAKWDGSSWSALGIGVDNTVKALAHDGTTLYAGGLFAVAGTDSASHLAKWSDGSWSPLLGVGLDGTANAIAVNGTEVYVGGEFVHSGGLLADAIAKWNGNKWSTFRAGMLWQVSSTYLPGDVYAIGLSGSDLVVGGFFSSADFISSYFIARWNGSTWFSGNDASLNGVVNALVAVGPDLYLGGQFHFPAEHYVEKWTVGVGITDLGGGVDGPISAIAVSGTNVYVGGNFNTAGSVGAKNIAVWNGTTWFALGTGADSTVRALVVSGGDLYAGGDFNNIGGAGAGHIARWDGSQWHPLGSGVTGSGETVQALVATGTDVYAGGSFTSAGGTSTNNIARWDGHCWSALGSGVSGAGETVVRGLATNGTHIYAVGNFASAGTKSADNIARWKMSSPSQVSTISLRSGWNLISAPVIPPNDSVHVLFRGATSNAFAYTSGGYQVKSTVNPGTGYWIKFPISVLDTMGGISITYDTIPVSQGWNLIGSISTQVAVNNITSSPPGMVTGKLFGYAGAYVIADSIRPGNGYWIKVNQNGSLILCSSSNIESANRIKIISSNEFPPGPPVENELSGIIQLPREFSLEQNYPNPFNPSTVMRYSLPVRSRVQIKIYDVLGQQVATLIDRTEDAGNKELQWNATDMPSGVYYYKLIAGEFVDVKKMLLLK